MRETARTMWTLFEPVHAVTYFAPQARACYEAAGLRGFWRGYFAGRAAPLGAVGPGPVYATFFGFKRAMVRRALPDVWQRAEVATVLSARLDGAREALGPVLGTIDGAAIDAAAVLMRRAAEGLEVAGRTLAAANLDLPWPDDPLATLWQAATILREHRGDGHVAALLVGGLDGAEAQVWRAALDGTRDVIQPNRGWSDEDWSAATERLVARGWLTPDGTPTQLARVALAQIEQTTDTLAAQPWHRLGAADTDRLSALLLPIASAARTYLPDRSPIGLPGGPAGS